MCVCVLQVHLGLSKPLLVLVLIALPWLLFFHSAFSPYLLSLSLVSFFVGFPLNFHCFVLFCFELHIEKRFFNFLKIQSKYVLHKQRVSREPRWKSEEGVGEGGCMRDNVR